MSVTVAAQDLTSAVAGTKGKIDFSEVIPPPTIDQQMQSQNATVAQLLIYNESPCGLRCTTGPIASESFVIAAGMWKQYAIHADTTEIDYVVDYVIPNGQVFKLYADLYGPGEIVDSPGTLGNSPIGGSVVSNIAQVLSNNGGQDGVQATTDNSGLPSLDVIYPFSSLANQSKDLELGVLSNGALKKLLQLLGPAGSGGGDGTNGQVLTLQDFGITGKLTFYNNTSTVGQGVPPVVARTPGHGVTVTVTTQQTVLTYTPATDADLLILGRVRLNNGTSGQLILFEIQYTDADSSAAAVTNFSGNGGGSAELTAGGATSFTNGSYSFMARSITAKASTAVNIVYRDPANTPNDVVTADILWIN